MPSWLESLKAWNAKKGGKYLIPKKGTPEYDAVREMMGGEMLKGVSVDAKPAPQNKKVLAKWMKPKKDDKPTPPKETSAPSKLKIAVSKGIREMAVEKAILKYKEKHYDERFFNNLTPIKLNYYEYGHLKTGKLFYVLKNPERFIDRAGEFWLLNVFELAEVKEDDYEVSPGNTADGVNKLIAVDVGSVSWSSNLNYYLSGDIIDDRHHQGEIDEFADTGRGFINIPLTSKYVPKTYRENVLAKMSKEYLNTTFPKGKDMRGKIITAQKEAKIDEIMKKFNHPIAVAQRKKEEEREKAKGKIQAEKNEKARQEYLAVEKAKITKYMEAGIFDDKLALGALMANYGWNADTRKYLQAQITGYEEGSQTDKIIKDKKVFTNEQKRIIRRFFRKDDNLDALLKAHGQRYTSAYDKYDELVEFLVDRWIKA